MEVKNHGFRTSFPHGRIDSWLPAGDLACGYHQWNLPLQFDDGNHIELLISNAMMICFDSVPMIFPVYGHVDGLNPYSINHKYPLVKQWLMVKPPLNPHVPIISPDFLHCSRASPSAIAPASCSRHELHGLEYHPRKVSEPEIHGGWMQHLRIQHVYFFMGSYNIAECIYIYTYIYIYIVIHTYTYIYHLMFIVCCTSTGANDVLLPSHTGEGI